MEFEYSSEVMVLRDRMLEFVNQHIAPNNARWHTEAAAHKYPLELITELKGKAYDQKLWNLFLPSLQNDEPGTRLSNLEYAPLAEIMGRYPWASEVFNCSAPDTGNMELLHLFANSDQRTRWLDPLLAGTARSIVCITEPDVASSDPTNLETQIVRDGDYYIINGRKWFSTGALHPNFAFALVLGVSNNDPEAPRHTRHSFVVVPKGTPGFEIVRDVPIMHHHSPEGHCEVVFRNVRVPVDHLIAEEGAGFALMQERLGPGRVHHCMRTIGQCELALELMCDRALSRQAFGKRLADFSNVQDWIAKSRIEIDQARLYVLRTAWFMDRKGNKAARIEVSGIKVVAAKLQTEVLDRAMQVFGAAGLTPDTPLSYLWTWGRALRFIDGPDEVHLRTIARGELDLARKATAPRNVEQMIYNGGHPTLLHDDFHTS
jgi:acyl-CoA dehydrogenase